MIRKDYLVKQFEEFGKVLAKILTFRNECAAAELELEIKQAVQRFTNLEIEEVEALELGEFRALILELDDHRLKILADLLFEKMHYYLLANNDENYLLIKFKCLQIYEMIRSRAQSDFDMDVYYKLQFLKKEGRKK